MGIEQLKEAFLRPSDEFGPLPFWFWNDMLDEEEIRRQILDFRKKGVPGFIIHPRKGVPKSIPYLSDRYMHYVKAAVELAEEYGMRVILYDEAMYPSGSAHGMVVKSDPGLAARCLRMEEVNGREGVFTAPALEPGEELIAMAAVRLENGRAVESVAQSLQGLSCRFVPEREGNWHVFCFIEGFSGGTIRGIHEEEDDGEPNAPAAADLLNPAAVDAFIRLTHERYYEVLARHFGHTVIAMFTDEPDVLGRNHRSGVQPWTRGFLEDCLAQGMTRSDLPGLWLDMGERTQEIRRNFSHAVNRRLETVYYGKLSDWCSAHRIALTGHPHESQDIGLLNRFQIPGQDLVWRLVGPEDDKGLSGKDSTQIKCASDAARHRGIRRNANECFGCCGPDGVQWAFSMDDMKWYMDWMFVRGVNQLYPHAFFYSVEGEVRYAERPPDVGPNNIWWEDYEQISRYMKRLSWLNTDSHNVTPVAVLCRADELPWKSVRKLYQNQIEFNYLEQSLLLSERCRVENGQIRIEKQQYRYLLVEDPALLTAPVKEKLAAFAKEGGKLLSADGRSVLTDVLPRDAVLTPPAPDLRVSHVVKEGVHFYLLTNEGESVIEGGLQVPVPGMAEFWDPWSGGMAKAKRLETPGQEGEGLCIFLRLQRRESAILCVTERDGHSGRPGEYDGRTEGYGGRTEEIDNGQQEKKAPELTTWIPVRWNGALLSPACAGGDCTDAACADGKGRALPGLGSWTQQPGLRRCTGRADYRFVFMLTKEQAELLSKKNRDKTLPGAAGQRKPALLLDLGQVGEIARVWVNGADCGVGMWAPYRFDLTGPVKEGENELRIEVRNSMANRLEDAGRPSGLLGPVRLKILE